MESLFEKEKSAGVAFSLFYLIFIVVLFIGEAILQSIFNVDGFFFKFFYSFLSIISFFIVIKIFSVFTEKSFCETVNLKKFNPIYILLSLLILSGMFFGLSNVNYLVSDFIREIGLNVVSSSFNMDNPWQLSGYVFSVALLPAIFEEAFFRGLMLNCLSGTGKVKAVIFSSLCFALYHSNASQLAYQFIYGIFLSILALKSKSIIPSALTHFLNNFILLLFLYFNVNLDFLSYPYVYISGILILGAVLVYSIVKTGKAEKEIYGIKQAYLYGSVGIAFTLLMIVLNLVL